LYSLPIIRLRDRFLGSNIVIGFQYGLIPLLLAWIPYHPINAFPIGLAISVFFFAVAITFCKDFSDYEGDKKYNSQTLPVLVGIKNASIITVCAIILSYLLVLIMTFFGFFPNNMFGYAIMIFPLGFLIKSIIQDPVKKAHRIFKIGTLIYVLGIMLIGMLYL